MDNISLWQAITKKSLNFPELTNEIEVDVAIIGGGITGITAALQLLAFGKKVAVLEAHEIGSGTTGNSTGNLYVPIQPYYQKVLNNFDFETVKTIANSRKTAMDFIEETVSKYNIPCNFVRRPMYLYATKDEQIKFLTDEIELLKKSNIDIQFTQSMPLSLPFKKTAVLENQARFNPRQYVVSISEHLHKQGCQIFENSRVMEIAEEKGKCIFKTNKGKVVANQGILATHTPTGVNPVQFYTAPYRSYVVAVQLKDDIYPEINCWNLERPHFAMSTQSAKHEKPDLLVIAGSHHKTGQETNTEKHYQELQNHLEKHFQVKDIQYTWSAQHYHAADGVPYIGLADGYNNIYEATGFFADGLVYGTISGVILSDRILNKQNKLNDVYKVKRHAFIKSFPFLIKENFNVFLQYMKDMPRLSSKNFNTLKKNESRVVVLKGEKCGAYRDENDKLHVVSIVCTHMKCILNWNRAEKTWDCPCHGSRFSYDGVVIEGPARKNLSNKSEEI